MADNQFFFEKADSQYGEGQLLDEYNGIWSLVNARKGNDGKVYMEWCFPQKKDGTKKPLDKSLPWKITFGTKDEMVATLRKILRKLSGEADFDQPNEDIPF